MSPEQPIIDPAHTPDNVAEVNPIVNAVDAVPQETEVLSPVGATNPGELGASVVEPLNPQSALETTDAKEKSGVGDFLRKRLSQIRTVYEGLTPKQKDILSLGSMAVAAIAFPVAGVLEGGHSADASKQLLDWEMLGGGVALEVFAAKKFIRNVRNNR